ncbi:hypothetical protein QTP88_001361 [Uroleucon formosanum]
MDNLKESALSFSSALGIDPEAVLNFTIVKFKYTRLDPTEEFNTLVQVITPSRYVNMSADFLRRIFSLMGNILSFILEQPEKYKRTLFLETEFNKISSMMYSGENVLVIESKTQDGCRVLLNRTDLIRLQYLEWSIHETVARKSTLIRPTVLKQFEIIGDYIDREFTKADSPPKNIEEMIISIKNLSDNKIIGSTPKEDMNFISQLKMFASYQLAEQWAQRWNGEMSPELFTESEMRLISPPQYSSISPMHDEDNEARGADEERSNKEFLTQATWAPTKPLPVSSRLPTSFINTLPDYDSDNYAQDPYGFIKAYGNIEPSPTSPPAVDENDGPSFFNHSPSILDFTGGKPTKKRNAKRKLFLNDIV